MRQLNNFIEVVKGEMKFMLRDEGVMLIMLGAIFIYTTLYSFAYHNQILTSMPIAVVDNSHTPASRDFIRAFEASPNVEVKYDAEDLESARQLFFERKVYGVMMIPSDFEASISKSEQTKISLYADASYFLMYKQMFTAFTSALMYKNVEIESARFVASGLPDVDAVSLAEPIVLNTEVLYNPEGGYATFVMPAIMLLILQQTLLLGIGIIGGTQRERGLYKKMCDQGGKHYSIFSILAGKVSSYFGFSILICFVVFGVYYKVLGYPIRSSDLETLLFFIPYILSSILLGITISTMFRYRETAIIVLVAWSLPFLLISGVSFPKEGINPFLYGLGKLLPSSSAINGFNRLHIMGASIKDIASEWNMMWILTGTYFVLAYFALKIRINAEFNQKIL